MQKKNFLRTASIITTITLISKLFGFIRELVIAYFFGTSTTVDIYVMAINIPTILLGFLTCVGMAYTPVFTEIKLKKSIHKAIGFTNVLILIVFGISMLFVLFGSIFSMPLVNILAPGFSVEMKGLTAVYLKISLWNIPVTAILNIWICYLQCNEKYEIASLCMLTHSSVQIAFTILAGMLNASFLVWGYLWANVVYMIVVFIASSRNKYIVKDIFFDKQYLLGLSKLLLPIFLSSMLTQINGYVDKFFASTLPEGSIASLNYANTIRTFIIMMLNTGLTTILYPTLSKYMVEENIDKAKHVIWKSVRYSVFVFIPVTIGVFVVSNNIISVLFGRGNFGDDSITNTSLALSMYVIGITAVGIRDIMSNFYYSVKDSKFAFWVSSLTIGINIVFNFLLVKHMGMAGLALGTSLSAILAMPFYFTKLKKYIGTRDKNDMNLIYVIKIIVASSIMGLVVFGLGLLPISRIPLLIIQVFSGILIYFLICLFMKIDEINIIFNYLIRRK
ncbi:MAG: murein biosynthesis integral membrane protein MurJ [Lachnospiraceae bacterium]